MLDSRIAAAFTFLFFLKKKETPRATTKDLGRLRISISCNCILFKCFNYKINLLGELIFHLDISPLVMMQFIGVYR